MKRVLLTGMSGTGKSTVTVELAARGYKAVDLDSDAYSEWIKIDDDAGVLPSLDWVWRVDRVQELLSHEDTDLLCVSGCSGNMGMFLDQFDHIILLSAPVEDILERLATRTTNSYGKNPEEASRVRDLINSVEPLLRKVAGHEIDTSVGLNEVVANVLRIASS